MKSLRVFLIAIGCAAFLLTTSGCLFIPAAVVGGYALVKNIESGTKGKTVVTFGQPDVNDTNALAAIHSLAVWPMAKAEQAGVLSSPGLAEGLASALKVVTPMAVMQAVGTTAAAPSLDEMTSDERREAFRLVADKTGADAVLAATGMASDTDMAMFKLSRASATQTFILVIYSRSQDAIIWQDAFNVKMSGGEVVSKATQELSRHILEITGKMPVTSASTNAPVSPKTP